MKAFRFYCKKIQENDKGKKKTDRPRFNCPILFCSNHKSMSESQVRILLVTEYCIDEKDTYTFCLKSSA